MPSNRAGLQPFPQTWWAGVDRARTSGEGRSEALSQLLIRYWPSLLSHLQGRRGVDADRAEDLLQGFVSSQVLEHELLARADQSKGRFRTFLLTALDRYAANQRRAEATRRRAIPSAGSADELQPPARGSCQPGRESIVTWARQTVAEALRQMRIECDANGRPELWGVFEARIVRPMLEGAPAQPYAQLVEHFHFVSTTQAANALVTAKRMFVRVLRSVIGEHEIDPPEIDSGIAELRAILACGSTGSAARDESPR